MNLRLDTSIPAPPSATRPRIGLVLGGGGMIGLAYHAAALTALGTDTGWDARTADVVVGTSAGSIIASLLRRGVPALDLAATAVGVDPEDDAPLAALVRGAPELPPLALTSFLRPGRVPDPRLVAWMLRHPWQVDPIALAVGHLADGRLDGADHREVLAGGIGDAWPAMPTWICAVRRRDLRRCVFGRDETVPLADAIAASCAVPGYFAPVDVDGVSFLDGGVHSPTNATTLAGLELDLAIIVSPMSTRSRGVGGIGHWIRRYARAKLDREVAVLRRRGIPSVVLQPGNDLAAVLGTDFMDASRTRAVVAASYFDVAEQLAHPGIAARLDLIRSTRSFVPR